MENLPLALAFAALCYAAWACRDTKRESIRVIKAARLLEEKIWWNSITESARTWWLEHAEEPTASSAYAAFLETETRKNASKA